MGLDGNLARDGHCGCGLGSLLYHGISWLFQMPVNAFKEAVDEGSNT